MKIEAKSLFFHLQILLAVIFCSLTFAEVLDSPWKDSDLSPAKLDDLLNNQHCWSDDSEFLACIGAIQSVFDLQGRDLQILPASEATSFILAGSMKARFGAAAVITDPTMRLSTARNALEVLRARSHRILLWRDWLRSYPKRSIRFGVMWDWIKSGVIEGKHKAEFTAAAINGYLGVTDAHARIVPSAMLQSVRVGQQGIRSADGGDSLVYSGIGAGVQPLVDVALVTSIVRQGPAANAGMHVNDVILAIDDVPVSGHSVEAMVEMLRGKRGTKVIVSVKRQNEIIEIPIVRDEVEVNNVISRSFTDREWRVAYLKIDSFLRPDTCREVHRALASLIDGNHDGLILDLRDNAGGLIDQALCVADLFLPANVPVLEIRPILGNKRADRIRTRFAALTAVPMVTLVNANTGSASEVLAGALQDHSRTIVAGELTFGKGTVQTVRPWQGTSSILEFFTYARYYRPSGVGVQLIGIEPDIPVKRSVSTEFQGFVILREADLFPTALEREPQIWRYPNPEITASLRNCVVGHDVAENRVRIESGQVLETDYILRAGRDALVCKLTDRS